MSNKKNIKNVNSNDKIIYIGGEQETEYSVVLNAKNTNICPNYANENEEPKWLDAVILLPLSEVNNPNSQFEIYAVQDLLDFKIIVENNSTIEEIDFYQAVNERNIPLFTGLKLKNKDKYYQVMTNSRWVKLKQSNYIYQENPNDKKANVKGIAYIGLDKNKKIINQETGQEEFEETIFVRTQQDMIGKFIVK